MVGREEERKRISQDLHDELGATITGAKMYLQSLEGNSDLDTIKITKAHASVSQCMIQVRQIMNDLYPISLDNFGFVTCLTELISDINQTNKLNIIFSNDVANL